MSTLHTSNSAALATTYIYEPLSSVGSNIRLVSIVPGEEDEAIEIEICETTLDANPAYRALSYAWGDPKPHANVNVVGDQTIAVASNLYNALKMLRKLKNVLPCWIDALCIHQYDDVEKAAQLPLMRHIYRHAEQVVIYLGEEADGSEDLPLLLTKIGDAYLSYKHIDELDIFKPIPHDDIVTPIHFDDYPRLGLPNLLDEAWEAMRDFLRRPWFQRLWVVQEAVLASNAHVVCGNWKVPLIVLLNTLMMARNMGAPLLQGGKTGDSRPQPELWRALKLATTMLVLGAGTASFVPYLMIDLLSDLRTAMASDSRDFCYAMLSMSDEMNAPHFSVDYTVDAEIVYKRLARALITQGDGIKVLLHGARPNASLPSWVPDLACRETDVAELISRRFQAHGNWLKNHKSAIYEGKMHLHPEADDILLVSGFMLDQIAACGSRHSPPPFDRSDWMQNVLENVPTWWQEASQLDKLEPRLRIETLVTVAQFALVADCVLELHGLLMSGPPTYPTGEALREVNMGTMAPNATKDIENEREAWSNEFDVFLVTVQSCYRTWREIYPPQHEQNPYVYDERDGFLGTSSRFGNSAYGFCYSLKRARSCRGYVGQFPLDTRVGDFIFLPLGSPMPLVFRLVDDKAMLYRRIGSCYVHGIMNGEAYDMGLMEQEIQLV